MLQNVAHQQAPFHLIRSDLDCDWFALGVPGPLPRAKFPVGLDNKLERFLQIAASLSESPILRVHTGNFLDGGYIPFSALFDDCGELSFHFYLYHQFITLAPDDDSGVPRLRFYKRGHRRTKAQ